LGMIFLPHFTSSIVARSLVSWAFVRALVTVGSSALEGALRLAPPDHPLRIAPVAVLAVLAIVAVLGRVSARRRNEDLFLLSLGYGRARLFATMLVPITLAELAIGIAVRL